MFLYEYTDRQITKEYNNRQLSPYKLNLVNNITKLYWDFVDGKLTDQTLKDFFAKTLDQRII
jgi:hypothetical protein